MIQRLDNPAFRHSAVTVYLAGVLFCAVAAGLLTDLVLTHTGLNVQAQLSQTRELLPEFVEWPALSGLIVVAWWPRKGK